MAKTVLITGGSSGIGEACAYKFAQNGYNVIITGRNKENLDRVKTTIDKIYSDNNFDCISLIYQFDIREKKSVVDVVEDIYSKKIGAVDVLINNAGGALGLEPVFEGDIQDWDEMIDSNIKGVLQMCRAVVPKMIKEGKGDIINIGSVAGDAAYANGAVYCATKSAVKTLSDGLRIDLVNTPLRVVNLKPGLVKTNFSNVRFHGDKEKAESVYKGIESLKAEDIADVAFYVVSAPAHVQIAEVLILATNQASGSVIYRK